jgi:hypothetical protein
MVFSETTIVRFRSRLLKPRTSKSDLHRLVTETFFASNANKLSSGFPSSGTEFCFKNWYLNMPSK